MFSTPIGWLPWALLSAAFAALTAIFGKVGVTNVNADLATLIRTAVILCTLLGIVDATGQWQAPRGHLGPDLALPRPLGVGHRCIVAVLLPRPQGGRRGPRRRSTS